MADPQRTEPTRRADDDSEAGREARLEQLLLSGLDEYFAGHYQEAINIWTRITFLERGHQRARAYIDRARAAMAERQRESEELLQRGIAAYDAGETERARDLLTHAVERGGPSDRAIVFLDRLSRASPPVSVGAPQPPPAVSASAAMLGGEGRPGRGRWGPTVLVSAATAAAVLFAMLVTVAWFTDPTNGPSAPVDRASLERLPRVSRAEVEIERARGLHRAGNSREALRILQGVDRNDPRRPEADRLRAELQQRLLSAAVPHPPPAAPEPTP